ncbi:MAG: translation initiation factor IF-2, partial [Pseudomonadales bacterium]|nr:translation initiation factor IF-2 [Pseudomonadales bacterium]
TDANIEETTVDQVEEPAAEKVVIVEEEPESEPEPIKPAVILSPIEKARLQKEKALTKAAEEKRQREKAAEKELQLQRQKSLLRKREKSAGLSKPGAKTPKATPKAKSAKKSTETRLSRGNTKEAEKARKEAEERARLETLAKAEKITKELGARGEDGSVKEEQELDLGSAIVSAAFDESNEREARGTKKESAAKRKARRAKKKNSHQFTKPVDAQIYAVEVGETIAVSDLARKMKIKGTEVVKSLMKMGVMASLNQEIDQDTAILIIEEMGHTAKTVSDTVLEDTLVDSWTQDIVGSSTGKRAPVVTIMGHVDHGKTSLLDYIRKAKVTDSEAGGITQHIGAYHVETGHGMITFLDTPGHAAFSAMRARGAQCTDVIILVVAADDGVMPQTKEAVDHAKASGVPLIVAINKMDKESADPDRVKTELSALEVIPEEWGGDAQFIEVSAHTGQGVDSLLDTILLQSEMLELDARLSGPAKGVVIESRLDKEKGAVASLLVKEGVLKQGDMVLVGHFFGRARAMNDENGKPIKAAGSSIPVEVLGLPSAPSVGEEFLVVPDEKKAREVATFRQESDRRNKLAHQQASHLANLFDSMGKADCPALNIVLKADVRGSLEAISAALHDLSTDEVSVSIVTGGVGGITESDVNLAMASGAVILGFNVRADGAARKVCQEENIELRYYSIIYELIDDVKQAMSGLLAPEMREEILGVADVREVYRSTKFGSVAGCMVVEGTLYRNKPIRILRDDVVIFEGNLESLRRFKDDVNDVRNGSECGLAVKGYKDVKAGDKIEVFQVNEIARSL